MNNPILKDYHPVSIYENPTTEIQKEKYPAAKTMDNVQWAMIYSYFNCLPGKQFPFSLLLFPDQ